VVGHTGPPVSGYDRKARDKAQDLHPPPHKKKEGPRLRTGLLAQKKSGALSGQRHNPEHLRRSPMEPGKTEGAGTLGRLEAEAVRI